MKESGNKINWTKTEIKDSLRPGDNILTKY